MGLEMKPAGVDYTLSKVKESYLMNKSIGLMLLLIGASTAALAGGVTTPEIDPAAGVAAFVMLSGTLLVIRGRRRKKQL
jgi:hypothetical protein